MAPSNEKGLGPKAPIVTTLTSTPGFGDGSPLHRLDLPEDQPGVYAGSRKLVDAVEHLLGVERGAEWPAGVDHERFFV